MWNKENRILWSIWDNFYTLLDTYKDTYQAPANEIHKLGIQNAQRHFCPLQTRKNPCYITIGIAVPPPPIVEYSPKYFQSCDLSKHPRGRNKFYNKIFATYDVSVGSVGWTRQKYSLRSIADHS